MCITSGKAKLSKTKILSIKYDSKYHLLAYANSAINLSGKPNSMILAVPGELSKEDFFDTTKYADFLKELDDAFRPRMKSLSTLSRGSSDERNFDQFELGMYTVLLSNSAKLIRDAIKELPVEKKPDISDRLLNFFEETYPKHYFVVCVFGRDKLMDSQPIMFKYKPHNHDVLFFPGVDAHDGNAPDLKSVVDVDHFLFSEFKGDKEPYAFDAPVPDFLQNRKLAGIQLKHPLLNGDWTLNIGDNTYDFKRVNPVTNKEVKLAEA